MQDILILDAGSSSVKFALLPVATWWTGARLRGQIEGLGGDVTFRVAGRDGAPVHSELLARKRAPKDPALALDHLFDWLLAIEPTLAIGAIGHRVVHGGSRYSAPIVVDDETLAALGALEPLAPLHQPYNVAGIRAAQKRFPGALQVACFDTAFHRTIPWENEVFALPHALYHEGVRRYGFHGLSYEYVTRALEKLAPEAAAGRVVIAHLGNGASMCAVENGRSVASTMGFSTLDGLPMGTRCGALDPGVLLYLMTEKGLDVPALTRLLYRDSGLKGLSGVSHDLRALDASGDPQAAAAIRYFVAQNLSRTGSAHRPARRAGCPRLHRRDRRAFGVRTCRRVRAARLARPRFRPHPERRERHGDHRPRLAHPRLLHPDQRGGGDRALQPGRARLRASRPPRAPRHAHPCRPGAGAGLGSNTDAAGTCIAQRLSTIKSRALAPC